MTIRVDPDSRYTTREQRIAYFDEVLRRVKEIPGVERAGITDALPLGRNRTWGAGAKGVTYERGKYPAGVRARRQRRLPRGDGHSAPRRPRHLGRATRPTSEPVMLVNETMARTLWPGQDPIGKYVLGACAKERRVVGVVGDVRHLALEQGSGNEMYLPMRQCGDQASADLVVRSALPPVAARGAIRAHAAADRGEPARQRFPHAAADRRQVGVAAALSRAAAGRLRRVRADPRLARHLRLDLVFGQPADAGDRHPHGARRVGAATCSGASSGRRCGWQPLAWCIGTAASWALRAERWRAALRRHRARPRNVRRRCWSC